MTEEEQAQLANYQAFVQNSQILNTITREMRVIPELPSEKSTDVQPLEKVEFGEKGGVYTYMGGFKYPYKGFPFSEFVERMDVIKKTQRAMLSSLYHSLKRRSWWQLAFIAFVPWLAQDIIAAWLYTFYRNVDRFKIKPNLYCDSIRELHRAFSIEWAEEKPKDREMRFMVRDIMCMFLEFDNAYRFRFQDVIVELRKENLKNIGKETVRLLELMQSRENTQEVKDTWTLLRYFIPLYFFFNRTVRRNVIGILKELDLSKVALDDGDKEFCAKRTDYSFGYLCQQQNTTSDKDSLSSTSQLSSQEVEPTLSGSQKQVIESSSPVSA